MPNDKEQKVRTIRNPSPAEIEKSIIGTTVEAESRPEEKETVDLVMVKPDESILSPKKHLHKLICGKHNYPDIPQINDEGEILIRRFSAVEESMFQDMRRGGNLRTFFVTLNEVLQNCVRSNIDVYKLYMHEQMPLFVHIIALSYGEEQEFSFECPVCNQPTIKKINLLKDLETTYMGKRIKMPFPVVLKSYGSKMTLYVHYPNLQEQATYLDPDVGSFPKLRMLVDRIEGKMPDGSDITEKHYDDIIKFLDGNDIDAIRAQIDTVADFGIDMRTVAFDEFCQNKACNDWRKPKEVPLPLEQLIMKIFQR